jgi:ribosomal protein S18 acetylase RimI-like enzyme
LYYNSKVDKPKRKLVKLPVTFGKLTNHNKEQFRVLNYLTLPVVYSEDFYDRLTNYQRYSCLGYVKDVLVGAISCRYEDNEEHKGWKNVYVMTITILKPYRRYGIGTQLLDKAIEECRRDDVKMIYLHVHSGNKSAIEFYTTNGFAVK